MLHEAKIAYYAFDAAILFATTIGPAVAKATWRHCLSHFIHRVAARTCCAVNVLTSRISFLFSWPWWKGSVVKHNMLKFRIDISPEKKIWDDGILGQRPVRCKIVVDKKRLQQEKNLKYLGCEIYYENEKLLKKRNYQNFLKYWEF